MTEKIDWIKLSEEWKKGSNCPWCGKHHEWPEHNECIECVEKHDPNRGRRERWEAYCEEVDAGIMAAEASHLQEHRHDHIQRGRNEQVGW